MTTNPKREYDGGTSRDAVLWRARTSRKAFRKAGRRVGEQSNVYSLSNVTSLRAVAVQPSLHDALSEITSMSHSSPIDVDEFVDRFA